MDEQKISPNQSRYKVSRDEMTTHIIEDRRATVSPWGRGNSKIGPGVYTYSKLSGRENTCPGSTDHCEAICYAKRVENPWVLKLWADNTARGDEVPLLPMDARLVRGHVSGDFDTVRYIQTWIALAFTHSHVTFWFYTRSWRVAGLLPVLEDLRALPNVQLWASIDADSELPPPGWRRAWLDSDPRSRHGRVGKAAFRVVDGVTAIACPEEVGTKPNCEACGYCFSRGTGERLPADLVFLEHV